MKKYIFRVILLLVSALSYQRSFGQAGSVFTVAGGGTSVADGVPATAHHFNNASGIWIDPAGNIYVADYGYATISKIEASTGLIYKIAGNGMTGYYGDGGPAVDAELSNPRGIWGDVLGNIYIADAGNNRIRRINHTTGIITTVAGGGSSYADGISALSARINPQTICGDVMGNIYTGGDNNKIRKINTVTGIITTVAGNGSHGDGGDGGPATSASINGAVRNICMDYAGNLFFTSAAGNTIRKINKATGIITTVAGGGTSSADGVPATSESFSALYASGVDILGNIFIADQSRNLIRRVDRTSGLITTVAGGGGSLADGVPATSAHIEGFFTYPHLQSGSIYYSNYLDKIRKFSFRPLSLSSETGVGTDSFTAFLDPVCSDLEVSIRTANYYPDMSVKTYFGDGSSATTAVSPAYSGIGGYCWLNHSYNTSGTFTFKFELYHGTTLLDSFHLSREYKICNVFKVGFFYDENGNSIKDGGEQLLNEATKTEVDSNGSPIDTLTAINGFYYYAYADPGDVYSFKVVSRPPILDVSAPTTGILTDTVSAVSYDSSAKYFGLTCSSSSAPFDLRVNAMIPVTNRGRQRGIIDARSVNCFPMDANVTLFFSPKYVVNPYASSPPPTSYTTTSATWHVTGLNLYSSLKSLFYCLNDNPATGLLTIGDTVHSYVIITPTTGDSDTSNNCETFVDTVKAGCDPNEIFVKPEGCIPVGTYATQLKYTINFENTGNDTAHNIYVLDTLSDNVDPSTLDLVMASSEMYISKLKTGGHTILKFDFPGINLLDSSHHGQCDGAVIYTIKTRPGLSTGTSIQNRAGIYFDYNDVVMTNTVENTIGCPTLEVPVAATPKAATLYPNPTTDELTIKTEPGAYQSFTITNNVGQVMMQQPLNNAQTKISIKSLPSGVYYVTIKGTNGTQVEKLVKW